MNQGALRQRAIASAASILEVTARVLATVHTLTCEDTDDLPAGSVFIPGDFGLFNVFVKDDAAETLRIIDPVPRDCDGNIRCAKPGIDAERCLGRIRRTSACVLRDGTTGRRCGAIQESVRKNPGVRDLVAEMPDIDRSFYLPWSQAISTSGEIAQGLPLVGRPFQMLMSLAEDTSVLE